MADQNPKATVTLFNQFINEQDLDSLASLISEAYRFIDSSNEVHLGRDRALEDWRKFFSLYPDYRNLFEHIEVHGDEVVVVGRSSCSNPQLAGPALWRAIVQEGLVLEWRVYVDTKENRRDLGLAD